MICGPRKMRMRLLNTTFFVLGFFLLIHFLFFFITSTTPKTNVRSMRGLSEVQSSPAEKTSLSTFVETNTLLQSTGKRETTIVSKKLFIAICVPTKSVRNWRSLEHTALQTNFCLQLIIPSQKTMMLESTLQLTTTTNFGKTMLVT